MVFGWILVLRVSRTMMEATKERDLGLALSVALRKLLWC